MGKALGYVKITLRDSVVEERTDIPILSHRAPTDLWSILRTIQAAGAMSGVKALLLVVKGLEAGWAQTDELRQAISGFRSAGKKVFAYLEGADNRNFYLASAADRIYLPPSCTLDLVGLRAEIVFLKNLLDSLGIQPQLFSLGAYKSAGEVFMRDDMSEANRAMTESLLADIQERMKQLIASQRGVDPATVQAWIDRGPYTARQALGLKMIDGLAYENEVEELLKKELPGAEELPCEDIYRREGFLKRLFTFYRPQIALVLVEGVILTGESHRGRGGRKTAGSEDIAAFLERARKRKRIKAVVLRINSPGGSALASDLLWQEVKRTSAVKPVIVSFGNVAASGGYYIAVAGKKILSLPGTLTGSIGVLGGKFNVAALLSRWGIGVEAVELGGHAGYASVTRPFSESEEEVVRGQLADFYENLFLKKVAEGRGRDLAEIRAVAEGRVWTGAQGAERGLVDEVGGILEAVERAREGAGLRRGQAFRVVRFGKRRRILDLLPLPLLEARLPLTMASLRRERPALMADVIEIR